jgi:YegS/Rv2252/BmrU family lipid kinase
MAVTEGPGDAARLAERAAREGRTDVIVAGGDGTINEALQGLIGTNVRLAVWPLGTANVLANDLHLPFQVEQVVETVARGKIRRVRVGCATSETSGERRYFLLMAGIGLDASIIRSVRPRLKRHFGEAAFWLSGLGHLTHWKPTPFEIEVDGRTFPATFASIGNAASYGGRLAITPRAEIDKAEFEILLANCRSKLRFLRLLRPAMHGNAIDAPDVTYLSGVSARAAGDAPVQVDGELSGHLPMRFDVARESIEVIVP